MAEPPTVRYLRVAHDAIAAVDALWDDDGRTFWRDTTQRSAEGKAQKVFPTVTCRCTEELLVAARLPGFAIDSSRLDRMALAVVRLRPAKIAADSDLGYLTFTLAQAVACCARIGLSTSNLRKDAGPALAALVPQLLNEFPTKEISEVHPFVRFHSIRALELARDLVDGRVRSRLDRVVGSIIDCIRTDTRELLAKHHLALITPAEHVVLAFCAVVLSHTDSPRDHKIALAALHAAVSAQDDVGSWPLGRVIQAEPSRLEISTYEVAWAAAAGLRKLLELEACDLSDGAAEEVLRAVRRAGTFAERSAVELPGGSGGWASDHPYQLPRVESWTSAIVLQFALAAEDLREEAVARSALATFSVLRPLADQWPPWLRWAELRETSEPSQEFPVYQYIQSHLIDRIMASPARLPSGAAGTASALLFGPPGTSKTTIVQAVADALGWPLVRLSPGSFIEKGLEAIESEARSVFERLQALRRAIVLFDECDELFRDRDPTSEIGSVRTISAFVTASMLPKLQDLHDTGRVLFFVCTNHIRAIDPAVRRGGRIDHRIAVGPPDSTARRRILERLAHQASTVRFGPTALSELANRAERFSRGELLRTAAGLLDGAGWSSQTEARRDARMAVMTMADSLTISDELYTQFLEDQERFSDPYLERTVTA